MSRHSREIKCRKPTKQLRYINENRDSDLCPLCNKSIKRSTCPHSISEVRQWWEIQRVKAMVTI